MFDYQENKEVCKLLSENDIKQAIEECKQALKTESKKAIPNLINIDLQNRNIKFLENFTDWFKP